MIAVTGGTGHIGNVLVKELIKENEKVRVLVPVFEDPVSIDGLDVEKVTGDVCDLESLVKAFAGADIVYHLAGIVSIVPGRAKLLYKVNVEGTDNVLKACKIAGVRRLVYTSSVHAFTEPEAGHTLFESKDFDPDSVIGNYAKSKAMAATKVFKAVNDGLDVVIVHPSGVIGPYEYKISNTGQMIIDFVNRRIPGCIKGGYDFVDVRDVAKGLILACRSGRSGENYILSGEYITLRELFMMLQGITGIKAPILELPKWAAIAAAPFIQVYSFIRGINPVITPYSLHTIGSNSMMSHEKASRELGYSPRPIRETVEDTVKWLKDTGRIKLKAALNHMSLIQH